jgi:hypothetical protein
MKKMILLLMSMALLIVGSANAVPDLQLFIAGGTYDQSTDTWVTNSSTFDLYVIGANVAMSNVLVSMALNIPASEDPNGSVAIGVDGTPYDSWTYGTPNLLPPHDIFPAWYTEFNSGNYGLIGGVGTTVAPELYNPSTMGYLSNSNTLGEFKKFTISISGTDYAHFDGFFYFKDRKDHTKIQFAPFSKDAESQHSTVPEPTSMALFGLGMLGMGVARKFRK